MLFFARVPASQGKYSSRIFSSRFCSNLAQALRSQMVTVLELAVHAAVYSDGYSLNGSGTPD
jgi:hypothetical protein